MKKSDDCVLGIIFASILLFVKMGSKEKEIS